MTLGNLWLVIDVIFWVGFFVLEGFDFGVGILHALVSRDDEERRICVNSIGPVWDANEVWLIVAGAVIFAAFPLWYATMFSTMYLALFVLILALIVRGVSFEYTRKFDDTRWQGSFKWGLTIGSALIPLLIGVALGDLLYGLPLDANHEYTGNFLGLLTPFGLMSGVTMLALSVLMGADYLALKTTGELHERVARLSVSAAWVTSFIVWAFVTWAHVGLGKGFVPNVTEVVALLGVLAAAMFASAGSEGWAFAAATVGVAGTVTTFFAEMYPNVMVATVRANSITVANSASPTYTLRVMTVVALVSFPIVLVYQGWTYVVFRRRLGGARIESPGRTSPRPSAHEG